MALLRRETKHAPSLAVSRSAKVGAAVGATLKTSSKKAEVTEGVTTINSIEGQGPPTSLFCLRSEAIRVIVSPYRSVRWLKSGKHETEGEKIQGTIVLRSTGPSISARVLSAPSFQ